MKKEDKKKVVVDLSGRAKEVTFAALTDFRGLSVAKMGDLRQGLREAEAEYQVVKNTLLRRASEGSDLEKMQEHFVGPNGLVMTSADPVATAKVLSKFAQDNEKFFKLKVAVLGGKLVDPAGIKALADLPSREELLAKLLYAMNGVPSGFVQVLAAVPRSLLNVLNAIADKQKEEQAA